MSAIEVTGLSKRYKGFQAVDDVSFSVSRGETFVLLGPNGAGKTTTIEILEGFRTRTSGEVKVLGQDPQKASRAFRARIGIVQQSAGDLGRLSVRDTITHFASLYPNPRKVEEVIEAVGLHGKASEPVKKLSGGQQHRVDVALGLIGNPEVLFLDEPTTGFDPEVRRAFWEVIRGLQQEGMTIMLTTHYLDEAEDTEAELLLMESLLPLEKLPRSVVGRVANLRSPGWRLGCNASSAPIPHLCLLASSQKELEQNQRTSRSRYRISSRFTFS
jgi:ABC-2 type transport system ATP-binding protein